MQAAENSLHCRVLPEGHAPAKRQLTSGSTPTPVETLATPVTGLFWQAMTIRDHCWHRRDCSSKRASIRYVPKEVADPPNGLNTPHWGHATQDIIKTRPGAMLSIFSTTGEQAEWLKQENSEYLMTYPSALATLAEHFLNRGETLDNLREVRTFGEIVEPSA